MSPYCRNWAGCEKSPGSLFEGHLGCALPNLMQIPQVHTLEKGYLAAHVLGGQSQDCGGQPLFLGGERKGETHGSYKRRASSQMQETVLPFQFLLLCCCCRYFPDSVTLQESPLMFNLLRMKKYQSHRERQPPAESRASVCGMMDPLCPVVA